MAAAPAGGAVERQFQLHLSSGGVDATWTLPAQPLAKILLAHGAGAGQRHKTMQAIADAFAHRQLATLRFNFPYMQQGKRRVDGKSIAVAAVAEAAAAAAQELPHLPLWLGGHSFGGRMCSHAVVEAEVPCAGLIFCSFPLHPAKKPATSRAEHLPLIRQPMLFLSGTRDDLADRALLSDTVAGLNPACRLHWLETANHSYAVLKRTRTNPQDVFAEMAEQAGRFVQAQR